MRDDPGQALLWATPLVVVLIIQGLQIVPIVTIDKLIAGLLALGLIAFAMRHPASALGAIVLVLPFQLPLFAALYKYGVPGQVLRPAASWKEVLGIGILAVAIRNLARARQKLDHVDLVILGYVALVAVYAFLPKLVVAYPQSSAARLTAFRTSASFVILFFACRHAHFTRAQIERLLKFALVAGTIVAGIGLYELVLSSSWNTFAVRRIEVTRYMVDVLRISPARFFDVRTYVSGNSGTVRVSSVLFSPLGASFYFVIGFAIACERVVGERTRGLVAVAFGLITVALLATQTRTGIAAGLVVGLLAFRPRAGRGSAGRARFGLVALVGLVLVSPFVVSSGVFDRFVSATTGEDKSSEKHIASFHNTFDTLAASPVGQGLATSAGAGQRFGTDSAIGENYYLQVGTETGWLGLALFVGVTVACVRRLKTASQWPEGGHLAQFHAALFGLALGAYFLHVWIVLPVAWTAWGLAGAALGQAEHEREEARLANAGRLPVLL